MWRRVVGGLGLMASAPVCVAGSLAGSAAGGLVWGAGAWIAVAAVALAYHDLAGPARRGPAAAMAVLGVAASAGTVEAAFRAAGGRWLAPHPALQAALACAAAAGLAGLAYAAGRAGLIPPAAGAIVAGAALLGTLTASPGAPFLLGAGPLGAVLLAEALRTRTLKGQP